MGPVSVNETGDEEGACADASTVRGSQKALGLWRPGWPTRLSSRSFPIFEDLAVGGIGSAE